MDLQNSFTAEKPFYCHFSLQTSSANNDIISKMLLK